MTKKPKCASRMLAFLMAVVMMIGSVSTTAYASDATPISVPGGSSTIIDDPVSGTTGSGWDNIDGGGSATEPSEEGGEDGNTPKPEDGGGDDNTSKPEEGSEDGSTSKPEDGSSSLPETPENGIINGTELPWAANFAAYSRHSTNFRNL